MNEELCVKSHEEAHADTFYPSRIGTYNALKFMGGKQLGTSFDVFLLES